MQQAPRDLALAVLEWVVHATRPPRISELQEALAVEPGDTELDQEIWPFLKPCRSLRGALITINVRSSTVRAAHFTVTYLLRLIEGTPGPSTNFGKTCLTYLLFEKHNSGSCSSESSFQSGQFSRLRRAQLGSPSKKLWEGRPR